LSEEFIARAPIGIAILRLERSGDPRALRIMLVNAEAARIADVPLDDAVGTLLGERFPEIVASGLAGRIAEVAAGGEIVDLGVIPGVYDSSRFYAVRAFPLPGLGVGLVFDEVTERRAVMRALEESEARFHKIFEASPVAICLFETETGALTDINRRFLELLERENREELIGRPVTALGMWSAGAEYQRLVHELRAIGSIRETIVAYRTASGQVRRAVVALELVDIASVQRVLALFWRI
jgi:PAS domain S-box-containing protein